MSAAYATNMKIIYVFMCLSFLLLLNPHLSLAYKLNRISQDVSYQLPTTTTESPEKYFPVAVFDWDSVQAPFIIALWILLACFAKIIFHLSKNVTSMFPDSSLLIMVGLLVGIIIWATNQNGERISLEKNAFFLFLLPPIVFDAGYFMPNRQFFDNMGTILTFAIIGTLWNAVTIGVSLYFVGQTGIFSVEVPFFHAMTFSSLISSTDPVAVLTVFDEIHVNEILYIVVFGESLLNDAIGVVLYDMFVTYSEITPIRTTDVVNGFLAFFVVGLGGVGIGLIWAAIISFTTRYTKHITYLEPLFIFVMAYCSYLTGQMFALSSIMAIVFCGLAMKQYVEGNISHKSRTTIKYCIKAFSLCAETIIFMFLGLSTVSSQAHWDTAFVCLTVLFCLIYRSIGVVFLSFIVNKFRLNKLDLVDQFVLSYGGLRGAMVYGLVSSLDSSVIPAKRMFVTATIVMIYFSVFVQGMTIKPLVNFLKVKRADVRDISMQEEILNHIMDHTKAGIEQILGCHGHNWFREKYEYLNSMYVKPFFMRQAPNIVDVGIVENFTRINVREAVDHLARYGSFHSQGAISSLTSLLRQHQSFDSNLISNDGNVNSEFLAGAPTLDMKVFDVKPGRKQVTAARKHHGAVDIAFRQKPKPKGSKVSPVENNFNQLDHNAQPYMVQSLYQKRSPVPKKTPTRKGKKGVRFDTDDEIEGKVHMHKLATVNDGDEDSFPQETENVDEDNYELTAAERELPWLRDSKVTIPSETNFHDSDYEYIIATEKFLPWKLESPLDSPIRTKFSAKSPRDSLEGKLMTATERELPWKRSDDETEFESQHERRKTPPMIIIESILENDIDETNESNSLNDEKLVFDDEKNEIENSSVEKL